MKIVAKSCKMRSLEGFPSETLARRNQHIYYVNLTSVS